MPMTCGIGSAVDGPDALVDEVLESLLAARGAGRGDLAGRDLRLQRLERLPAAEDRRPERPGPAGVARLDAVRQGPTFEEVSRDEQGPRQRVDAADVGVEQVDPVAALAAQLGVEVEAA